MGDTLTLLVVMAVIWVLFLISPNKRGGGG